MFALRNCPEGLDWRLLIGPNSVDLLTPLSVLRMT